MGSNMLACCRNCARNERLPTTRTPSPNASSSSSLAFASCYSRSSFCSFCKLFSCFSLYSFSNFFRSSDSTSSRAFLLDLLLSSLIWFYILACMAAASFSNFSLSSASSWVRSRASISYSSCCRSGCGASGGGVGSSRGSSRGASFAGAPAGAGPDFLYSPMISSSSSVATKMDSFCLTMANCSLFPSIYLPLIFSSVSFIFSSFLRRFLRRRNKILSKSSLSSLFCIFMILN